MLTYRQHGEKEIKMKVFISYQSRYKHETLTSEYNAIKISTDSHFVNITAENGEVYGYPHSRIVIMRVENEE